MSPLPRFSPLRGFCAGQFHHRGEFASPERRKVLLVLALEMHQARCAGPRGEAENGKIWCKYDRNWFGCDQIWQILAHLRTLWRGARPKILGIYAGGGLDCDVAQGDL
jgi:hypothetical protein